MKNIERLQDKIVNFESFGDCKNEYLQYYKSWKRINAFSAYMYIGG